MKGIFSPFVFRKYYDRISKRLYRKTNEPRKTGGHGEFCQCDERGDLFLGDTRFWAVFFGIFGRGSGTAFGEFLG